MRNIIIDKNEVGQRLDKYLLKYMNKAPKAFLYKMMRKKNIVLNGKRCEGNEKLNIGDEIKLWLSEETIEAFMEARKTVTGLHSVKTAVDISKIVYEDSDIILYNKSSGELSQKSKPSDISVNELLLQYMMEKGEWDISHRSFKPSICNRLDRNTSGLMIFGKSLSAIQTMNEGIKNKSIQKYYLCIVKGKFDFEKTYMAYLKKDEKNNMVEVRESEFADAKYIETAYRGIYYDKAKDISLVSVNLLTGRTHQIRAHLEYLGYPILGDSKYGNTKQAGGNGKHIRSQLLHAYMLSFPKLSNLSSVSERCFIADVPKEFKEILGDYPWELGKPEV